jgi:hypothetical protein
VEELLGSWLGHPDYLALPPALHTPPATATLTVAPLPQPAPTLQFSASGRHHQMLALAQGLGQVGTYDKVLAGMSCSCADCGHCDARRLSWPTRSWLCFVSNVA